MEELTGPMIDTRWIAAWILVVASSCGTHPATEASRPPAAAVASIVDGDTLLISFHGGRPEVVRLLGIDTPETVDPNRPVQCFGAEASARLDELLPVGTAITVEVDVEPRDRYRRLLAYVYRVDDGMFVNEVLLAEGFADLSIYEPNTTHAPELRSALRSARTSRSGLWSACGGADVPLDPPPVTGAG